MNKEDISPWKTKTRKRTSTLSLNEMIDEMVEDEYDTIVELCTKQKANYPLFRITPTKFELKTLFRQLIGPAILLIIKQAIVGNLQYSFYIVRKRLTYIYHRIFINKSDKKERLTL